MTNDRVVRFLTQSPWKISSARAVLEPEYEVAPVDVPVPEVQAETSVEVARHQAIAAARRLGVPVARLDIMTCFAALHGMPGPYAAYFERALPIETLLELIDGRDHTAYWILALAYAQPSGACTTFEHRVDFTLAPTPRGDIRHNWNRSMTLIGDTRTLAEYPAPEHLPVFATPYVALKAHLDGVA